VLLYGHVMPATRLEYYDSLERRPHTSMDLNIFSTAMFLRDSTEPQQ
jgi:hypothetical protein